MGTRDDERPERVFPGRNDPWFVAVMTVVASGLSVGFVACFVIATPLVAYRVTRAIRCKVTGVNGRWVDSSPCA